MPPTPCKQSFNTILNYLNWSIHKPILSSPPPAFIFGAGHWSFPATWVELALMLHNLIPWRKYLFFLKDVFLPVKGMIIIIVRIWTKDPSWFWGGLYVCGFGMLSFYIYNHKELTSNKQNSSHFLHIKRPLIYLIQYIW